MKYGCIGEHLKHSFSKEIHGALADYEYEIREIEREALGEFAASRDFLAINVTIPYKEEIMPYLYEIDDKARAIGAVNTVVNRDGRLYGYNTDFFGMASLIRHAGVEIKGKKVIILGTGGTSKTSLAVARALGAREIVRASRTAREDAVAYSEVYERHSDAEVVINTTPVGMFPSIFDSPIDISKFERLEGVIDAVYNPLRTELILSAKERGIAAEGGLYMLVAQGVRASEIFLDTVYPEESLESVFNKIRREKENIVLIGMPASGKSTVGALLAEAYGRELIDTDALIVKKAGKPIPEIFAEDGEAAFRDLESEVIREVARETCKIIATGGGAVLREGNVRELRKNGRVYFIDRPLASLVPTDDRPLSSTREAIEKRYSERYEIYCASADERIDASCDAVGVSALIKRSFDR